MALESEGCLVNKTWGSAHSCLLSPDITSVHHHVCFCFILYFCGFRVRSSSLQGKHLRNWFIFPHTTYNSLWHALELSTNFIASPHRVWFFSSQRQCCISCIFYQSLILWIKANISLNPLIFVEHSFFFWFAKPLILPRDLRLVQNGQLVLCVIKCTLVLFSIIFSAYSTVLGIANFIGGSWEVNECRGVQ